MGVVVLGIAVVLAGILGAAGFGHAALARPTYDAGDRWVYTLLGSLGGLPGFNASQNGSFQLGLSGIVEVDVVGVTPSGVQAETHAAGFLNGTFAIPGNATVRASGSFSSDTKEVWEGGDYLPVASNGSTVYGVDVTVVVTAHAQVNLWVNATTVYASLPPFNLSVGDSASASFTSHVDTVTSFSSFGLGRRMENRTTVSGAWTRHVLAFENVTVEAGTFSAYRINESLGGFPGFAAAVPSAGANETAWFSNDVGNYVRRDAYVNGTRVAQMRLKSYAYPIRPPGLSAIDLALLGGLPAALVAALVLLVLRRRKAHRDVAKDSRGAEAVGELPPKKPGGPP
ncbi:MAG TPA: hypothetical protein VEY12_03060 [Thermoplasmata archaeon]|nr:hypothetical protein [Thermoplasmata archaeon]